LGLHRLLGTIRYLGARNAEIRTTTWQAVCGKSACTVRTGVLLTLGRLSEPTRTNVSEVVGTGPGAPPIATVDDLAGQRVFVRKGASTRSSGRLNDQLKARGKPAVVIDEAADVLRRRPS